LLADADEAGVEGACALASMGIVVKTRRKLISTATAFSGRVIFSWILAIASSERHGNQ
jgi:hypothetical protein